MVSGLAYGIDAAAHAGALEGGGPTVAALASGLDRPSPVGNRGLAVRILESGGTWLSEHPPGTPALAAHFPERNRLISGLARVVVIVEAREASGTLWTARHASEQHRDVLVVPGPIDSAAYRGSNALLRGEAGPLLDAEDLFVALGLGGLALAGPGPRSDDSSAQNGDAARVLARLVEGPAATDEIGRALGLSAQDLARILLDLELDGRIRRTGSRIARGR